MCVYIYVYVCTPGVCMQCIQNTSIKQSRNHVVVIITKLNSFAKKNEHPQNVDRILNIQWTQNRKCPSWLIQCLDTSHRVDPGRVRQIYYSALGTLLLLCNDNIPMSLSCLPWLLGNHINRGLWRTALTSETNIPLAVVLLCKCWCEVPTALAVMLTQLHRQDGSSHTMWLMCALGWGSVFLWREICSRVPWRGVGGCKGGCLLGYGWTIAIGGFSMLSVCRRLHDFWFSLLL